MEIQAWLDHFKAKGFSVNAICRERLEKEIVDRVNNAIEKKRRKIEVAGKVYMRSVAREMIRAARERGSDLLREEDLEQAQSALGPLPVFD